jgi:O-antigen ligase
VQAGQDFASRAESDLVSGILHSSEDDYWQFRLSAWREAWKRFGESPLAGEGFGVPFTFDIWDNDPRPHNTFLTVLYKMGLIGFLPLIAFLGYFFWASMRAVRRNLKYQRVVFLQIVVLAQCAFCLFGAANLMIESPYLASLLWVSFGVGLRMIRMLDVERLVRERRLLLVFSK